MSFFKKLLGAGKKLGDPFGLISKKNKMDFKNWKDPLNLWTPRSGSGGSAGGPGGPGGGFGSGGGGPSDMYGKGPLSMSAFMGLMPSIMGNSAAFARPAAQQWLQSTMGYNPQPQAPQQGGQGSPFASLMQRFMAMQGQQGGGEMTSPGGPGPGGTPMVPEPGMMYAGGTPGFYSGGRNTGAWGGGFGNAGPIQNGFPLGQGGTGPFGGIMRMMMMQRQQQQQMPYGPKQLNRFSGPFGNGGGASVPNPFMAAGLRQMYGGGGGDARPGGYNGVNVY